MVPGSRPNILIAVADDWSFGHAGAYGCRWVNMPEFDRVARTGTPADAFVDDDRKAEERGYLHVVVEYDALQEYLRGEWDVPWRLRLEIQDSIWGRNLSELSFVTARLTIPLLAGRSSAG